MRTALLPLLLFTVMVGLFAAMLMSDRNPQEIESARVGGALPTFSLAALYDEEAEVSSRSLGVVGGKPVLINFFASWCVPCRAEHDALTELAEKHGIAVVGIAYKDDPADSKAFLAELGDPYSQIGIDLKGRTAIDFGVSGVPETFIAAPDGTLTYRHWGPIVGNGLATKVLPALREAGWTGESE